MFFTSKGGGGQAQRPPTCKYAPGWWWCFCWEWLRLTNVGRKKSDSGQLSEPDRNINCRLTGIVLQRRVGAVRQQEPHHLQMTLTSRFVTYTNTQVLFSLTGQHGNNIQQTVVYVHVSLTVFEILTHKARKQLVYPAPPLFDAPVQENPSEFLDETYSAKTRGMGGYSVVKIAWS